MWVRCTSCGNAAAFTFSRSFTIEQAGCPRCGRWGPHLVKMRRAYGGVPFLFTTMDDGGCWRGDRWRIVPSEDRPFTHWEQVKHDRPALREDVPDVPGARRLGRQLHPLRTVYALTLAVLLFMGCDNGPPPPAPVSAVVHVPGVVVSTQYTPDASGIMPGYSWNGGAHLSYYSAPERWVVVFRTASDSVFAEDRRALFGTLSAGMPVDITFNETRYTGGLTTRYFLNATPATK